MMVPMTAMPQRIAISHVFGALAATLVGIAEYSHDAGPDRAQDGGAGFEVLFGALTVTGSFMAFGKLQELAPGRPITYHGQNAVNLALFAVALRLFAYLVVRPGGGLGLLPDGRPRPRDRRARWCCPSAAPTCRW